MSPIAHPIHPPLASDEVPLPGDEFIGNPRGQFTDHLQLTASPARVWPWLVQMGHGRGGFYGAGWPGDEAHQTREVHPEWQNLHEGDVIAANDDGDEGFEVLCLEPHRQLVLGHLHDVGTGHQVPFSSRRPPHYWQITWTFLLSPLDDGGTRLLVRARFASAPADLMHAAWIHPVCRLMRNLPLAALAARIEGKRPVNDGLDVVEGLRGAGLMLLALLSPFARNLRGHWGLTGPEASRHYPGDELVEAPRWSWTHGIEIDAPAASVWPWLAQIGATRAGFYSYQWLENAAGCELRNAETLHPDWEVREGDPLVLHPRLPPLRVERVEPGWYWVAHAPADPQAYAGGKPWVEASWLFLVESLGPDRCRFISRYRVNSSTDIPTRLSFGPTFAEPIGFAMDRRMLAGVKERAERARLAATAARPVTSPSAGD